MIDDKYKGEKFLLNLYQDLYNNADVKAYGDVNDSKYEIVHKYLIGLEEYLFSIRECDLINSFKDSFHNDFVIKKENIPSLYIEHIDRVYFNQTGKHMSPLMKEYRKDSIVGDQIKSLDEWIDYLVSDSTKNYPMWVKYWIFRGVVSVGSFNKYKGTYTRRSRFTVSPFPELNREILSKCVDIVLSNDENSNIYSEGSNFIKLYSKLLSFNNDFLLSNNFDGEWVKYPKGDDYMPLYNMLQGKNTGWCTAGLETCKMHIKEGDFYVYYTYDQNNNLTVPRLAIRMDGEFDIDEVRGVASDQNIEPYFEEVLDKKLREFDDYDDYKKRIKDTRNLTRIYSLYENGEELSLEDLKFLYEIDDKIESFGWDKDPRIDEIINSRDSISDLNSIFEICKVCKGDLNLNRFYTLDGLKFPEEVKGDLLISNVSYICDAKLPLKVGGIVDLRNLKKAFNFTLPAFVGEDIYLTNLVDAFNIDFPSKINGSIYLSSLVKAYNLIFPDVVDYLDLRSLKYFVNSKFPRVVLFSLNLNSLSDAKGIKLPEIVGQILDLSGLKSIEGLELPKELKWLRMSEKIFSSDELDMIEKENDKLFSKVRKR